MALFAGSETEAYCGKCKMILPHIIVAMKGTRPGRVQCKTCSAVHAYRKTAPRTRKLPTLEQIEAAARMEYDRVLDGRDLNTTIAYSFSYEFAKDDLIRHKTFGVGVVLDVLADRKIEVLFPDCKRVMIHNRNR